MKKTLSIHIKGFPFIIEEIAYTRLENYLNRLKSALKGQEGADEIIEDIEIRIAELLNAKTTQFKQIIEDSDIIDVLNTLGDPSDYAENDEKPHVEENNYSSSNSNEQNERRLYRDTENSYIGGVCSGLASYFSIDVTIIRLIWLVAFLIGGVGFLLYLVLWVIIPKANSSIDRLKMKGRPINVDTVKEEVERAAQNVSEKSKQFANQVKNDRRIKDGVSNFKKIVRSIVGGILLFIGFSSLIVLITFVFGAPQFIPATSEEGFLSINSFAGLILNDAIDLRLAWISFYVCSISFVIFFLLGGFVSLFNIKNKWYRYVNFLLIFLGMIGFSVGMIVASRTGRDYAISGEIEKEIISINSERLIITPQANQQLKDSDYVVKNKSLWALYIGENNIIESGISVRYHPSKDSLYHVILEKEANAHTLEQAVNRAKNIKYNYQISNDTLIIPAFYSYPLSDKIRNQEVSLHIYIPKGKTVAVADEIIDLDRPQYEDDDDFEDKQQRGKIRGDGSYRHKD
jgi:phage shock protein PspC (stress-responsive transcriptional regulator)